jgi:protein-tyrosine phosphatase
MPSLLRVLSRSPTAKRLRQSLRDAFWRVRGAWIRNPRLPVHAQSILFVCKGNICRSPFASALASSVLAERGRSDVRCGSAGLQPSKDGVCPPAAIAAAAAYGVDSALNRHEPVALTTELVDTYDLILVMEAWQLAALRGRWPQRRAHFFLLPLFASDDVTGSAERFNIQDPFGKDAGEFDRVYRRTEIAVRALIARLTASVVNG